MISYAITDPTTLHFHTLDTDLKRFREHRAQMIVYRDKDNGLESAKANMFMRAARKCGFEKVLLHTSVELSAHLGSDGVHLSSSQFHEIVKAKSQGLFVVISTHSPEEAKRAEVCGADMITYSPVFETPGKGKPVGLQMLTRVTQAVSIPVLALGGVVTQAEVDACEASGASGFASIRYFA